jgi:hypothetical protein
VGHDEIEGTWPEAVSRVGPAHVVVCHHVFYNAPDLADFVEALTGRARRRVVVELTGVHPQASLDELWRRFHGIDRPAGPTPDDAFAVLAELGLDAGMERWEAPSRWSGVPRGELVAFTRRRLCLPAERDAEVDAALDASFALGPRPLVTVWWPGQA